MATNKEARSSSIEEDQTWVLDSLVGFLGSPLWSSSLNDFTDQKSIVFDPDDIETEEGEVKHRIEYEIIFKQYRSLVDRLIGSHMNDLGIDENQFARACEMADDVLADKLKKILFEEFWAAENYEVFVRLMAKRNVELQLEALEMLARKYGMIYDVFVPIGSSAKNFLSEEHAVREAILRSLNDLELQEQVEQNRTIKQKLLPSEEKFENNRNNQQEQSVLMEEQQKQKQTDKEIVQRDAERLIKTKAIFDRKMDQALQLAMNATSFDDNDDHNDHDHNDDHNDNDSKQFDIINDDDKKIIEAENKSSKESVKSFQKIEQPTTTTTTTNETLDNEKINQRAQYLRTQRDKILLRRKKDRNERISKYLIKEKERRNESDGDSKSLQNDTIIDNDDEDHRTDRISTIAFRQALVARLKAEIGENQ